MSEEQIPQGSTKVEEPGQNRFLGIDFGMKRVGIAVSDPMGIIARGIDTFANDGTLMQKILDLAKTMSVSKIVIGKPLKLSGQEGNSALAARRFAELLKRELKNEFSREIEIIEWDERFTTTIAQRTQIDLGIKKKERQKKGNLDRMASQIILQSYLDSRRR